MSLSGGEFGVNHNNILVANNNILVTNNNIPRDNNNILVTNNNIPRDNNNILLVNNNTPRDNNNISRDNNNQNIDLSMDLQYYLKNLTIISPSDFPSVADLLLNKCQLIIAGKSYRLAEIEFYLTSADHPDCFTHCNKYQLTFGNWYFHSYHNGNYKGGTYKGLDLTLGESGKYLSILLRTIVNLETGQVIEGPCLTVNHILQLHHCEENIGALTKYELLSAFNISNNQPYLIYSNQLDVLPLYQGPRIGLKEEKNPDYAGYHYRYVTNPSVWVKKEWRKLILMKKPKLVLKMSF